MMDKMDILVFGGICYFLDMVKCLVLGVKVVGFFRIVLELVECYFVDDVIVIFNFWKEDLRMIMCVLNCKKIIDLW